jgi:hypothetical protein
VQREPQRIGLFQQMRRHPARIAMATGLALVLRSNTEIPEDYWRTIVDYPATPSSR